MPDVIGIHLGTQVLLAAWGVATLVCLMVLSWDIRHRNAELGGMMRLVWRATVAYSGPLGLVIYYYSGRKQIRTDNTARRAFRSVAHCYSGCGAGEILGVTLMVGVVGAAPLGVSIVTFLLAYSFGLILTIVPLVQDGNALAVATKDAIITETASIVAMEAVAIGADLGLSGDAGIAEARFWGALVVSLSAGLLAAYPVNVLLIQYGIKSGMHDPRAMATQ